MHKNAKHGMWKHPLYQTWNNMMQRCYDPGNKFFPDYGGRGIYVDECWHDPRNLVKDMGLKPKNTVLDRIENDGPYTKENCRWASLKESARNKRNVKYHKYNSEAKSLAEWSDLYGLSYPTLYNRVVKAGWPIEEALTIPIDKGNGGRMCTKERRSRFLP